MNLKSTKKSSLILVFSLVLAFLAACSSAANTTEAPFSEDVAEPATSDEAANPPLSGEVTEPAINDEAADPPLSEKAAEPSNPGGPGEAVNLTGDVTAGASIFTLRCSGCHGYQGKGGIENPGSSDGTIPPLNPIDSTLASPDYKTFASNIDKFIEHGSTPEGDNPEKVMTAFGDEKLLTPQMIANVIAYVISLNQE